MEQKILEGLKKSYSNLGLSDKVFETHAKLLAGFAGEVAEDEQEAKVAELVAGAKDMLTAIQSFGDSRASKKNGNKGGEPTQTDTNKDKHDDKSGDDSEMMKLLKEMNESLKASNDRIAALEGAKKQQSFDDTVKSVAKELGLTGKYLEYAKALLSDEMDETAIRNSLGKAKKDFVKMGLHVEDDPGSQATADDKMRSEEAAWVEQFVKSGQN